MDVLFVCSQCRLSACFLLVERQEVDIIETPGPHSKGSHSHVLYYFILRVSIFKQVHHNKDIGCFLKLQTFICLCLFEDDRLNPADVKLIICDLFMYLFLFKGQKWDAILLPSQMCGQGFMPNHKIIKRNWYF